MLGGRDPVERLQKQLNDVLARQDRRIASLEQQAQRAAATASSRAGRAADGANEDALDKFRAQEEHYASVILLLGYGGFFALWSSAAGQMPRMWFGLAGVLMGVSLLLFIVYELAKTFASSFTMWRGHQAKKAAREIITDVERVSAALNRAWVWVFLPAVLTGLLAGAIVLAAFGHHAFNTGWGAPSAANPTSQAR